MLKFYLVSTVISIVVCFISGKAVTNRLKREGYYKKADTTFAETLHTSLYLLVPIFNVFLALVFIFASDQVYEKTKQRNLNTKGECRDGKEVFRSSVKPNS